MPLLGPAPPQYSDPTHLCIEQFGNRSNRCVTNYVKSWLVKRMEAKEKEWCSTTHITVLYWFNPFSPTSLLFYLSLSFGCTNSILIYRHMLYSFSPFGISSPSNSTSYTLSDFLIPFRTTFLFPSKLKSHMLKLIIVLCQLYTVRFLWIGDWLSTMIKRSRMSWLSDKIDQWTSLWSMNESGNKIKMGKFCV